jgi:hypothetical protein
MCIGFLTVCELSGLTLPDYLIAWKIDDRFVTASTACRIRLVP